MSIWYTQIHMVTVLSHPSMRHVPETRRSESCQMYLALQMTFLIVVYNENGIDHDRTLCRILKICRKENLKLNKDKYRFRCISIPFFGKIISRCGVHPDPQTKIPPPRSKKKLQPFLCIMNYLNKHSLETSKIYRLKSIKSGWLWIKHTKHYTKEQKC